MTRIHWWSTLAMMSGAVLCLDVITGSYLMFPIMFVVPVSLGAWYLGRGAGIGFAIVLVGCRLAIATTLETETIPLWAAAMNAGIRMLVLVGLAVLIAKVVQQQHALEKRIQVLEGILPICMFCKKIRCPDGQWEQVETYVGKRSPARFSHGLCEACGQKHYGEYFTAADSEPAGSGTGPGLDDGQP